jgi:hypothetical protein
MTATGCVTLLGYGWWCRQQAVEASSARTRGTAALRQQTVLKGVAVQHHRRRKHIVFALWVLLLSFVVVPQEGHTATLTAAQAKDHVGEPATVCGVVASATFATRTKGQPTFLNLDQPYPNPSSRRSTGGVIARSLVSQKSSTKVNDSVLVGLSRSSVGSLKLWSLIRVSSETQPQQGR